MILAPKRALAVAALSLLVSGCGNPLSQVERLDDVALAPQSGDGVAALPSPEIEGDQQGVLQRLFGSRKPAAPREQVIESEETSALPADEAEKKPADAATEATDAAPRRGLFGFLSGKPKTPAAAASESEKAEAAMPVAAGDRAATEPEAAPSRVAAAAKDEARNTKGVLAWLRRQKGDPAAEETGVEAPVALPEAAEVQTAHLDLNDGAGEKPKGLWAMLRGEPADDAQPQGISFGTTVPFGEAAILCDYPKRQLGKLVAQYPEKAPIYRLYDSQPGEKSAHSFYIKGFADGCLRQVTASVAVFGSVEMHEQLRYGLPADLHPYSDTDKAYEKLKRQVCKVGRKAPCGDKLDLLQANTVFLSFYDSYGNSQGWANLLLHDQQVLALDVKGLDG